MQVTEMKSVTVYDSLNRKHIIKPGETWVHGNLGVVTVTRIVKRDNKTWTTTLYYKLKNGEETDKTATYFITHYVIKDNFLFKIA